MTADDILRYFGRLRQQSAKYHDLAECSLSAGI